MREWSVQARAKVNLTLDVLRRRPDGYHDVDLLMQSITLCDVLHLEESGGLSLAIEGGLEVQDDNLALRAARLLAQDAGICPRARIRLVKRIPVAAGLGGGSADAAAALAGLNALWELHYPMERLLALAARLGADVPFCLTGGCRRATGIGTELNEVQSNLPLHLVVLKPCAGLLTREIFGGLRLGPQSAHPDTAAAAAAVRAGDRDALGRSMGNLLEEVAMARRPEIARALQDLRARGAWQARMSGSGPSVFGLFGSREEAQAAAQELHKRYPECFAASSAPCGVQFV